MTALSHELLTRLEASHRGKLSEEEQQELDADLAKIPGGAEAATEFRQLWQALQSLQAEEQRTKLQEWETSWQTTADAEWIELYLSNQLSEENRQKVEERREQDEAFASQFSDQEKLFAGFSAAKDEHFREQLSQWDEQVSTGGEQEAKVRPMVPRWRRTLSIAATVLLLIVAGLFWNNSVKYSDEALADKYYQNPPTGNLMGAGEVSEEAAYQQNFTDAHSAMQFKDYDRARLLFEKLGTTVPPANFSDDDLVYYQDNLDWNLILALLGQNESGGVLQQRLDVILASPNHTYYTQAQQLQEDLDKFWRW
ncbi:MAG: hypothetical protein AAFR36_07220 [Bacteroidota bacterium]